MLDGGVFATKYGIHADNRSPNVDKGPIEI